VRDIHRTYDYGTGFRGVTLANGKRADSVNLLSREVNELKPDNPAAIARGERQVKGYAQQLNTQFPGRAFKSGVLTYRRP